MTKIDGLKPKHGEELVLKQGCSKTLDTLKRIRANLDEAQAFFAVLAFHSKPDDPLIICRQCFIDIAMRYEEVGSLMRELADLKK